MILGFSLSTWQGCVLGSGRYPCIQQEPTPIKVLKYKKKKIEKSNFQAYRISVDKRGGHLYKNIAFNITKTVSNRGLSK